MKIFDIRAQILNKLFTLSKPIHNRPTSRIRANLMNQSLTCNVWQRVPPIWTEGKEPMRKLSLEIRVSDDVTVVYCRGRIVYDQAATLSEKLADLLPHCRHMVLELSGVRGIDCAGLGELVD